MQAGHHGSCQCGAIDFNVTLGLDSPVTCNCSRCRRLGVVLAFTPRSEFTLNSDPAALSEYLFNRHVIRHQFCAVCGIQPFAFGRMPDGSEVVAVNLNCLDGVDTRALSPTHVDGAAS
jgi:hypothetical protein